MANAVTKTVRVYAEAGVTPEHQQLTVNYDTPSNWLKICDAVSAKDQIKVIGLFGSEGTESASVWGEGDSGDSSVTSANEITAPEFPGGGGVAVSGGVLFAVSKGKSLFFKSDTATQKFTVHVRGAAV